MRTRLTTARREALRTRPARALAHDVIERPEGVAVQYRFRHDSFGARYHSGVELRHLRSFFAVAEELHFGRAAARLHISQPPLSQQIRRLEDELGARLFRRTKRRVELTPAGSAFLTEARQTLAQAERTVRAAQRAERGEQGELAVGYVTSATYGPLPDVIRRFRQRFPDVELRLQNLRSVEQRQALVDRRIDVGFVRLPVTDPRIIYEALWRESVCAERPGSPRASRTGFRTYKRRVRLWQPGLGSA